MEILGLFINGEQKKITYSDNYINLPIPFPNKMFSISIIDGAGKHSVGFNKSNSNNTKIFTEMPTSEILIYWLAIGY